MTNQVAKIALVFALFTVCFSNLFAQAPADKLEGYIDKFSGDVSYSVPVLSVPSPLGPAYTVSVSYKSGIGVEQTASKIGLGWDINFGEIRRTVNGFPDDFKGEQIKYNNFVTTSKSRMTNAYGPIYFKDYNNGNSNNEMDVKAVFSSEQINYMPNYDSYVLESPFLTGILDMHFFEMGTLKLKFDQTSKNNEDGTIYFNGGSMIDPMTSNFTKQPQLRLATNASRNATITNNIIPYQNHQMSYWEEYPNTTTCVRHDYQTSDRLIKKAIFDNVGNANISPSNHLIEGTYIKYLTNQEINQFDPTAAGNALKQLGFLDYRTVNGTRRPTANFPENGIGAIVIVDANGLIYNFSLPVYTNYSVANTFNAASSALMQNTEMGKYARLWKLTSITDANYVDANNNGIADAGDEGYWIAFDYQLVSPNLDLVFPKYDLLYDGATLTTGATTMAGKTSQINYSNLSEKGYNTYSGLEEYALNKIKTESHTAVILKEKRKDESEIENNVIKGSVLIKELQLFRNGDLPTVYNSNTQQYDDGTAAGSMITYTTYNQNKAAIDAKILSATFFDTDYSLCKKYIENVNVSIPNGGLTAMPIPAYLFSSNVNPNLQNKSYFTYLKRYTPSTTTNTTNYTQSGKLTLKGIQFFSFKHNLIGNGEVYDYYGDNSTDNPDFPLAACARDEWGYYKSDYANYNKYSNYRTAASAPGTMAWSLKAIRKPSLEKIKFNYESDVIESTNDDRGMRRIVITSTNFPTYDPQVITDFDNSSTGNARNFGLTYPELISNSNYDNSDKCFTDRLTILRKMLCEAEGYQDILNCPCTNSTNNEYVVLNSKRLYAPNFREYYFKNLYGGGIRVKSVEMNDEQEAGKTYTFDLTYAAGNVHAFPQKYSYDIITEVNKDYSSPYYASNFTGYASYVKQFTSPDQITQQPDYYCSFIVLNDGAVSNEKTSDVGYGLVKVVEKTNSVGSSATGSRYYNFSNQPIEFSENISGTILDNTSYEACSGYCVYKQFPRLINSATFFQKVKNRYGKLISMEYYDNNDKLIYRLKNKYEEANRIDDAYNVCIRDHYEHSTVHDMYNYKYKVTTNNGSSYEAIESIPFCMSSSPHITLSSWDNSFLFFNLAYKTSEVYYDLVATEEYLDGATKIVYFSDKDPILGVYKRIQTTDNGITSTYTSERITGLPIQGHKSISWSNKHIFSTPTKATNGNTGNVVQTTVASDILQRKLNAGATAYINVPRYGYIYGKEKILKYVGQADILSARTTLINEKYKILETESEGGRYSAIKYGYGGKLPIASLSRGRYGEFVHTSLEDDMVNANYFSGEGTIGNGQRILAAADNISAHTGEYVLKVNPGSKGFSYVLNCPLSPNNNSDIVLYRDKKYMASVWVYNPTNSNTLPTLKVKVGGVDVISNSSIYQQCGNWSLMRLEFKISPNSSFPNNDLELFVENTTSAVVYLDDFRFHPFGVGINAIVYDQFTELPTYEIDIDNFYIRKEYDALGRLTKVYKETPLGEKLVTETKYNLFK